MPQVSVTIAGRSYRMACGEGEEEHLQGLGRRLDERIGSLRGQFGELGDSRIVVMAALTLLDDLSDAERRIAALEDDVRTLTTEKGSEDQRVATMAAALAQALDAVTAEVEGVARSLLPPAAP